MIRNLLRAANALTFGTMVLLLFAGCNKNTIIFEDGTTSGQSSGNNNQGNNTLITFNASVEGRNILRSMSPMQKGIQNRVYVFGADEGTKGSPEASGLYITSSPGMLTGSDGYKMFLSNGTYNFYAVSDNFSTIPPTFTDGISEPLLNGIDYLWWSAIQQDVNSSQINIPIVYAHVATQVVVEITGGEGITINQLVSAMITPPETGATMDLGTGVITPATAFGKADKMGINGLTAQYIMLPIRHSTPMTLTLEIFADNENNTRTYTAQIPLPDGELKAGNSYFFKAVINVNSITLASVSVKDWTDVDETGKPLYPTQN